MAIFKPDVSKLRERGDVSGLVKALLHKSPEIRRHAARVLGPLEDPGAVEPLIAALVDEDDTVRYAAAEALGRLGDQRAVESLIAALEDEDGDRDVREAAAKSLGGLGDRRAVEPLIAVLKDDDPLRPAFPSAAASALGELGDTRAVEPLLDFHADQDSWVRSKAASALEMLGVSVPQEEPSEPQEEPWPPAPAGVCDLCNRSLPEAGSARVPGGEFRMLVRWGYNPVQSGRMGELARALYPGNDQQVYASWITMALEDTTDWGLCAACAADLRAFKVSERTGVSIHPATDDEHYVLRCKACDFEHHIPAVFSDANSRYSVNPGDVTITCLYGGVFTVSLQVDDFFDISPAPTAGHVLAASIALNMNPLHDHMLTHISPIYLVIEQGSNYTRHKYRKEPEGTAFVEFSRDHGINIVGDIDISKAEIPGVS
jgi:hypothetical protein